MSVSLKTGEMLVPDKLLYYTLQVQQIQLLTIHALYCLLVAELSCIVVQSQ